MKMWYKRMSEGKQCFPLFMTDGRKNGINDRKVFFFLFGSNLDKVGNMVKEVSFSTGDFVVYPTHGVGKVLSITKDTVAGQELELIAVRFDKDRMTLRVPMTKARNSGLRKLSNRNIMDTALETLRSKSKVKRTMWSRRAQEYEAKINSGDPVSIAEVVRDLYRSQSQSDQSYSERQIYEQALDRLANELAALEKINTKEATVKLCDILELSD